MKVDRTLFFKPLAMMTTASQLRSKSNAAKDNQETKK